MKKLFSFFTAVAMAAVAIAQPTNKPISQLTTTTAPAGGWVPIVTGGATRKVAADSIGALFRTMADARYRAIGYVPSLSSITAATGSNTIANGTYVQQWDWSGVSSVFGCLRLTNSGSTGTTLRVEANTYGIAGSFIANNTGAVALYAGNGGQTGTAIRSASKVAIGTTLTYADYMLHLEENISNNYVAKISNTSATAGSGLLLQSRGATILKLQHSASNTDVFTVQNTGSLGDYYFHTLQNYTAGIDKIMGYGSSNKKSSYLNLGSGLAITSGTIDVKAQTILTPRGVEVIPSVTGDTLTIKNKTYVTSITSASSITINADTTDMYSVTALAANLTINAPTGTFHEGQPLLLKIKDDGTSRTLTFNSVFRASTDFALPTATTISKKMYLQFIYDQADNKWDAVGLTNGF